MKIIDIILDLIYPQKCCFCHKITDGSKLCSKCEHKLSYTMISSNRTDISHVSAAVSPLRYEGDIKQSVLRYKFHSATGYAEVYAQLIAKCIDENQINCDIISWVPLSRKRRRTRGYNQAELIGLELSKILDIPAADLLLKIKDNPPQSGTRSSQERKVNVKGVYRIINPELFSNKTVLIVDDVITTGSTISECARMLKDNGCKEIFAASLAMSK